MSYSCKDCNVTVKQEQLYDFLGADYEAICDCIQGKVCPNCYYEPSDHNQDNDND